MLGVAAAWLAVGTQPSAQTLLLGALGLLYLLFPPSGDISRSLLVLMGLLFLLACTAFVPATWFGASFRQPLLNHGIVLSWTLSPQPWWSWEDLTLLFAGLLWMVMCFHGTWLVQQREFLIGAYLLALGVVGVNEILRGMSLEKNLPDFIQQVGQFENQNQTGDLLVMGGVFAFARGLSEIIKGNATGIAWIALTLVFLIAVILNASRAALVLLLVGLILLSIFMPKRRGQGSVFGAVLFFVSVLGLILLVLLGTGLMEKFNYWLRGGESRISIYQDAAAMLGRIPWCGVGLGNFEGVFNSMRTHSLNMPARNLHPESDWFWVVAELGLPGVFILVFLLITTFRVYFWRSPFPDLAKPSIIVAVLFLIHTFFDVGGHRPGTAWSCLYLVSLGAFATTSPSDIRIPQVVWRGLGFLLLIVTVFRIQSTSLHPWMPTRASLVKVEEVLLQKPSLTKQQWLLDRGLTWAPLDWLLYYQRGLVCLQSPGLSNQADDDFNRALYLEQSSLQLPLAIGNACSDSSDMPEALAAWKELLRRAGADKEVGDLRGGMFESLMNHAGRDEKKRLEIASLAEDEPDLLAIAAIVSNDPQEFNWYLHSLLDTNASLQGVSSINLRRLFNGWVERGDPAEFIQAWPLHPEWRSPGWNAYARALAQAGRYREAVMTALENMPAASIPAPLGQLNVNDALRQYQSNPQDPYNGMMLYLAQMASGAKDQALNTLMAVAKLPNRPVYIQLVLAKQLLDDNQEQAAWQSLDSVLNDQ
jgi:hypothetical protein